MADILLRNLDQSVVRKLRKRAKSKGRSMANELRTIVSNSVENDIEDVLEEIRQLRSEFAGRKFSDSIELLREDRQR